MHKKKLKKIKTVISIPKDMRKFFAYLKQDKIFFKCCKLKHDSISETFQ